MRKRAGSQQVAESEVTQAVGAPRELNSVGDRTAYVPAVLHFIATDYSTRPGGLGILLAPAF